MNKKLSERASGYMELEEAQKDADCQIVSVSGGVSSKFGCCNLFDPEPGAKKFTCGTCEYVTGAASNPDKVKQLSKSEAGRMSFSDVLNSERPAEGKEQEG